ncbi:hypothetical protein [Tenacibaculum maritimum]|uniref:hypothetical protein n=3 Tax=Tenacibaculum maritimum TaxID=107401 RepID=UPI0010A46DEC|nr:hypothetical protein [Tenacibaculum maritimum]MCD9563017.1 hypothetical protein [Tenacibaculum maritimum]MCD9566125.1 hypothetical protein [Tenacibaculum maritimum]MCD9579519.1 hypothetical protein [Tenacibaculum maritimum]MCD9580626.1 hypothetical protein [Tenacibaculum maritimum]MCD9585373.1 hypothetical protein [Tenacibaculum maritimum]
MIKYLKREELDVQKYDECIEASIQSMLYAYSWYLDIVAESWAVLVLNDYEAVMPLPWKRRYAIAYITQPYFCQQLGVFSKNVILEREVVRFIKKIPKYFFKVVLQFNFQNKMDIPKAMQRENYVLSLKKGKTEIFKNYNKNRKRDYKKAEKRNFTLEKNLDSELFIKFIEEVPKNYELDSYPFSILKNLAKLKNQYIFIWGIKEDNALMASLLFLKDKHRITYLMPIISNEGKKRGYATLLVTKLIETFSESDLILDFEGSMLEGIARFYRSFGAKKETYYALNSYFFDSFFIKKPEQN